LQELPSNYPKLQLLIAFVVSVREKARKTCQVWVKETNESEPLMKYRNALDVIKTKGTTYLGINATETCLLVAWCPVLRWRELYSGFHAELGKLYIDARLLNTIIC
jgi:hypothetical protein